MRNKNKRLAFFDMPVVLVDESIKADSVLCY